VGFLYGASTQKASIIRKTVSYELGFIIKKCKIALQVEKLEDVAIIINILRNFSG